MLRAKVLRRQAESCLRLSQSCCDPLTADHLRMMAADFFQHACKIENARPGFFARHFAPSRVSPQRPIRGH
jgi:hypothetical protein